MNQSCHIIEKVLLINSFFDPTDLYQFYVTSKSVLMSFSFAPIYFYTTKMIQIETALKRSSPSLNEVLLQYELLSRLRIPNSEIMQDEFLKRSYALKKCLSYTSILYNYEKMPCYYCKLVDATFKKSFQFTNGWTQFALNGTSINCDTNFKWDVSNYVDVTQCIFEESPGFYTCTFNTTDPKTFTICSKCANKYKFCTVSGYAERYGLKKKDLESRILNIHNFRSRRLKVATAQEYIFRYGGINMGNGKLLAPIEIIKKIANQVSRKRIYKLNGMKKSLSYK
jgi:hypothetical protein